jgi:2-hydroxychromene-2-carboxylate isomerase
MDPVNVYFDYVSPFAYITSEVLPGFGDRVDVSLRWKPIDLMQLSNYENGLPYSPVKRRYVAIDAARSAEHHGIPIRLPKPHPVQSATALRLAVVALAEPTFLDLHRALFRAAWLEQRDLSSRDVLADCIAQAKGPVEEWLLQADLPETIERLETLTSDAEAEGIFGVPSMLLGGELFWGLDSLPTLEWRLEHPRVRNV